MRRTILTFLILLLVQPAIGSDADASAQTSFRERFMRIRQMRQNQSQDMSMRERIKRFREFRSKSQNSLPQNAVAHLDQAYGAHERQKLDIYVPKNARNLPVFLYIHGGAWQIGNKSMVDDKPQFFTEQNWIFVSANYRLLPDGKHPANVQDVASALAWVHENIEKYGGKADSIVLCGFSAGAHLAALAALDGTYLKNAGKSLEVIKAVVLLDNPVSDVIEEAKGESHDRMINAFGTDPEIQRNASPVNHVSPNGYKPAFIIAFSGGMPPHSPMKGKDFRLQASILAGPLEKTGARVSLFPHENLNHTELNRNFASANDQAGVTAPIMKIIEDLQLR